MTNYEWIKSLSKGDMLAFLEQVWCSGFNDAQAYRDDDRVCAVTGHGLWGLPEPLCVEPDLCPGTFAEKARIFLYLNLFVTR